MRLIGGCQLDPDPQDHALLRTLFHRLPREVVCQGATLRFLGLDGHVQGHHRVRFLGVEAADGTPVPEGCLAWELGEDRWTLRNADGALVCQGEQQWLWRTPLLSLPEKHIGEFAGVPPLPWRVPGVGDPMGFSLFACGHLDPRQTGYHDEIELVAPRSEWPEAFQHMAQWLAERLAHGIEAPEALRLEHYGSTAIPGLPAKPVIDMLLEIPSLEAGKRWLLPRLDAPEWEYWRYDDHLLFIRRQVPMGVRTHHLHAAPADHPIWKGLAFRDRLRHCPEEAAQYAALKQALARTHGRDREGYTQAKGAFVQEITQRALVPAP